MIEYSTPQYVEDTGRKIWGTDKVTLSALQHLLTPKEMLVGCYDRLGKKTTVAIQSENDINELYAGYMSGQIERLWYYAMPDIEIFTIELS